MTEPWMTTEEALQWCDAATEGLQRGDDLLRLYQREILDVREPLLFARPERVRAANMLEEFRDQYPQFEVRYNVYTFCVALLRAVKS